MDDVRRIAESVFRAESGRIMATLIRHSGSFHMAEEAIQDAFTSAIAHWPKGIPDNPAAWITTCARRKIADAFRRRSSHSEKEEGVRLALYERIDGGSQSEDEWMHYPDDRLRLIFTCCHPAINRASQVALTLRTLCGLKTEEIARAFLLPEATLAQRLVRAKDKIQTARIPYCVPSAEALPDRLASVQAVIYLVFNEGYSATAGSELTREMLCEEGIRLGRMLNELMPGNAETTGLVALMLLQDSRRFTRMNLQQEFVPLDEQDRSQWDQAKIQEGITLVDRALRRREIGPYQLQAAIAALHAQARSPDQTDWTQIAALYGKLHALTPTPVVALNRAVAVSMAGDLAGGLSLIDEIGSGGQLNRYHLYHAARGELLRRMGQSADAKQAYTLALDLVSNDVERRYLLKRLGECSSAGAHR